MEADLARATQGTEDQCDGRVTVNVSSADPTEDSWRQKACGTRGLVVIAGLCLLGVLVLAVGVEGSLAVLSATRYEALNR